MPSFTKYSSSYKISEGKLILLWITSSIALAIGIFILDRTFEVWTIIPYWYRVIAIVFMILLVINVITILYDVYSRSKRLEQEFSKNLLEAQEADKKKIASELHDGLQQNLHSINFEIHRLAKSYHPMKWKLDELTERINESINDIRSISSELYPHQLEILGLSKTIISVSNKLSNSTNIYFDVTLKKGLDELFNYDSSINIYRIIQELCNNIVKHSLASQASINLNYDNVSLYINVSDNGKGLIKNYMVVDSFRKGLGISSIEKRIKYLQGKMDVSSEHDKGTTFKITIPVKNKNL